MATTKRTRNASGAGASESKRRVGASTRRAQASTRSKSKKTPGANKRAARGTSRSAAKATPTRSPSKRRQGTAARDPKPIARVANKAPARAPNKAPARVANKAPARASNKALSRDGNKGSARAPNRASVRLANKAPARVPNKAAARAASGALSRGGTGKRTGAAATKKQPIVARNQDAAASGGGRRQSDVRRRDGAGHIDPKYAADLLARGGKSDREEDPSGFIEQSRSGDDLAENLGEEFVASATSGENQEEEVLDQEVPEERGGPFVESTAGAEFAWGTDASNPKDAKREPFPTT